MPPAKSSEKKRVAFDNTKKPSSTKKPRSIASAEIISEEDNSSDDDSSDSNHKEAAYEAKLVEERMKKVADLTALLKKHSTSISVRFVEKKSKNDAQVTRMLEIRSERNTSVPGEMNLVFRAKVNDKEQDFKSFRVAPTSKAAEIGKWFSFVESEGDKTSTIGSFDDIATIMTTVMPTVDFKPRITPFKVDKKVYSLKEMVITTVSKEKDQEGADRHILHQHNVTDYAKSPFSMEKGMGRIRIVPRVVTINVNVFLQETDDGTPGKLKNVTVEPSIRSFSAVLDLFNNHLILGLIAGIPSRQTVTGIKIVYQEDGVEDDDPQIETTAAAADDSDMDEDPDRPGIVTIAVPVPSGAEGRIRIRPSVLGRVDELGRDSRKHLYGSIINCTRMAIKDYFANMAKGIAANAKKDSSWY